MDDLIRRQAVLDALTENKEMINAALDSLTLDYNTRRNEEQRRGQINEDIETIKALPSAHPEPKWIPCSERLPEDSSPVLITHRGGVSYGWYNGRYFERGANTNHRKLQTVIAWMPLPDPWKGEEE